VEHNINIYIVAYHTKKRLKVIHTILETKSYRIHADNRRKKNEAINGHITLIP
jgi:hypothetical protein